MSTTHVAATPRGVGGDEVPSPSPSSASNLFERGTQAANERLWFTACVWFTRAIRSATLESATCIVSTRTMETHVTPLVRQCWMARANAYFEQRNFVLALRDLDTLEQCLATDESVVTHDWDVFCARLKYLGALRHYKEALIVLRDIKHAIRSDVKRMAFWTIQEVQMRESFALQLKDPDALEATEYYLSYVANMKDADEEEVPSSEVPSSEGTSNSSASASASHGELEGAAAPSPGELEGAAAPSPGELEGAAAPSPGELEGAAAPSPSPSPSSVRTGAISGKGVFANRAFAKGDVISVEPPLVVQPFGPTSAFRCIQCGFLCSASDGTRSKQQQQQQQPPPCNECGALHCSDVCRAVHSSRQCDALWKLDGPTVPPTLKILARWLTCIPRTVNLMDQCSETVMALPWPPEQVTAYEQSWIMYGAFVGALGLHPAWFDYYTFDLLYGIIDYNAFALIADGTADAYGAAVYATGSYLNHGCQPNARVATDMRGCLVLHAIADIGADDELTIRYDGEGAEGAIAEGAIAPSNSPFGDACTCNSCLANRRTICEKKNTDDEPLSDSSEMQADIVPSQKVNFKSCLPPMK